MTPTPFSEILTTKNLKLCSHDILRLSIIREIVLSVSDLDPVAGAGKTLSVVPPLFARPLPLTSACEISLICHL